MTSNLGRAFLLRTSSALGLLAVLLALSFGNAKSYGFYYFYVNDGGGAHIGLVAEQIIGAGGGNLDYQFYVLNVSGGAHPNIDGFTVKTGPQGGLAQQVSFTPPALNPGYGSNVNPVPAGLGGGTVPFLATEGNTFSPVPWAFTESDNRGGGGAAAITGYKIRWNATGNQPLPYFRWTRFDLVSPNGPIAGSGAVDPPATPSFFDMDIDGGLTFTGDLGPVLVAGTDPNNPNNAPFSSDPNPFDNDPTINVGGIYDNVSSDIPEPTTLFLGLCSASLLCLTRRRKSN